MFGKGLSEAPLAFKLGLFRCQPTPAWDHFNWRRLVSVSIASLTANFYSERGRIALHHLLPWSGTPALLHCEGRYGRHTLCIHLRPASTPIAVVLRRRALLSPRPR